MRPLSEGDGPALQRFNAGLSEQTRSTFLPHGYDEITVANYIGSQGQPVFQRASPPGTADTPRASRVRRARKRRSGFQQQTLWASLAVLKALC